MRILIFTDTVGPKEINGVVRTLDETVKNLKLKGHIVRLVSSKDFYKIPQFITKRIYPECTLAYPPFIGVRKIIHKFKPNAIHIATEGTIGWTAWIYCNLNKIKFTTAYHTKFPEYAKEHLHIPVSIGYMYEKLFHNKATATMVATDSLKEHLESYNFNNLFYWERGVDQSIFHPNYNYKFEYKAPIALFFGRVSKEKNIETFCKTKWIGQKIVIGDGPELAYLKTTYPDVVFLGKMIGTELAQRVQAADIVVFPSLTDTYGLTIIESLSCGTPVAGFNITGPKDIIKNGVTGYLADYHSNAVENLSIAMHNTLKCKRQDCLSYASTKTWSNATDQFISNLKDDTCTIKSSRKHRMYICILTKLKRFLRG
jgi:glycosyltransferase involved in cell wall biosynthesis